MSKLAVKIRFQILKWYDSHRRSLPWRGSRDPYIIWISEIIFQQTRIEQGTEYFRRFIQRFPSLEQLADANQEQVLREWQGLGYYNRARNLHETARYITNDLNGEFPNDFESLLALKGVGDYTAACIASICFDLPTAAVDGNVYRVLSRLFADATPIYSVSGIKKFKTMAGELLDQQRPGDFNEAMMDLGATVCKPKHPDCVNCPVARWCKAFAEDRIEELPLRRKQVSRKKRYLNYFLLYFEDQLVIKKRGPGDIWTGLYELPRIENNLSKKLLEKEVERTLNFSVQSIESDGEIRHMLSHQELTIRFFRVRLDKHNWIAKPGWIRVTISKLSGYPFPKPIADYLVGIPGYSNLVT